MAVKSSPRGKRSKPHCLEVELVKTVFGAAAAAAGAGVVEAGRRAAAVHGRGQIDQGKCLDALREEAGRAGEADGGVVLAPTGGTQQKD